MNWNYQCKIEINQHFRGQLRAHPLPPDLAERLDKPAWHKSGTCYMNFTALDLWSLADKLEEAAKELREHGLPS